jgi:hypothetical protein
LHKGDYDTKNYHLILLQEFQILAKGLTNLMSLHRDYGNDSGEVGDDEDDNMATTKPTCTEVAKIKLRSMFVTPKPMPQLLTLVQ